MWGFGAVLFELFTGIALLPEKDLSDDNLSSAEAKAELANWLVVDERRLNLVFQMDEAGVDKATRLSAQHLVWWCLQRDESKRPSVQQVKNHPFLMGTDLEAAIASMTVPPIVQLHHFFLSHFQKEATDSVKALYYQFKEKRLSAWTDMNAKTITVDSMRDGVRNSEHFVFILTRNVLTRPFCWLEAITVS